MLHFFSSRITKKFFILGIIMELCYLMLYCIPLLWPDPRMPISLPKNIYTAEGAFCIAILVYGIGYWIIRKSKEPQVKKIILLWLIVFSLTLILIPYPLIGSADVLNYIMTARETVMHHANPYIFPTSDFVDPNPVFNMYGYVHNLPLVYGPAWAMISIAVAWLGKSDVWLSLFLFQFASLIASLGSIGLIWKIARKIRPGKAIEILYLFAWNPLWLFETIHNAHNESFMIFFFLCALYFLFNRSWKTSMVFLVVSCLVKYIYIILAPFFFWYALRNIETRTKKLWFCIYSVAIFVGITILCFAPFWQGAQTLEGLKIQATVFCVTKVFPPFRMLIYSVLMALNQDSGFATIELSRKISLAVFCVIYAILFIVMAMSKRKFLDQWLERCVWVVIFFLFLVSPLFNNWYALWIFPLIVLWGGKEKLQLFCIFVFTVGCLLSYLITRNNASIPFMIAFAGGLYIIGGEYFLKIIKK